MDFLKWSESKSNPVKSWFETGFLTIRPGKIFCQKLKPIHKMRGNTAAIIIATTHKNNPNLKTFPNIIVIPMPPLRTRDFLPGRYIDDAFLFMRKYFLIGKGVSWFKIWEKSIPQEKLIFLQGGTIASAKKVFLKQRCKSFVLWNLIYKIFAFFLSNEKCFLKYLWSKLSSHSQSCTIYNTTGWIFIIYLYLPALVFCEINVYMKSKIIY